MRVFISVILVAVLSACGYINTDVINKAVELCADNGGLVHVRTTYGQKDVRCVNGAVFYDVGG